MESEVRKWNLEGMAAYKWDSVNSKEVATSFEESTKEEHARHTRRQVKIVLLGRMQIMKDNWTERTLQMMTFVLQTIILGTSLTLRYIHHYIQQPFPPRRTVRSPRWHAGTRFSGGKFAIPPALHRANVNYYFTSYINHLHKNSPMHQLKLSFNWERKLLAVGGERKQQEQKLIPAGGCAANVHTFETNTKLRQRCAKSICLKRTKNPLHQPTLALASLLQLELIFAMQYRPPIVNSIQTQSP
ncbi:uncharacterized protein LACBIDRAFT_326752 [Laccaria bicolor S238N-H82]|uniref:Predicted protein n=1 Tax=Laccaria bicolor (strain S238N-H82 / ATCC MYA-4686) TaxID=486041 RepID=B0D9K2_LACBS|nr:uncharacterized protein LACBIDRAFT_326752 [Laccaria bicolor S238N-H82]EDR08595.1 predicted protein [Laccaria bicolor S238N-H82]|eukprot:XP_001880820.1 predicted protein [Laccaria bicolor S238N-H82]